LRAPRRVRPILRRAGFYAKQTANGELHDRAALRERPRIDPREGIPKDRRRFTMDSRIADLPWHRKDQPLKLVPYMRRVSVYIPAGYLLKRHGAGRAFSGQMPAGM